MVHPCWRSPLCRDWAWAWSHSYSSSLDLGAQTRPSFWAKVSLRDESAGVPLIICVPGKKPAVCHSFVELLDLYPTTAALCGLEVPRRLQGKDISRMLSDPDHEVRDEAFCVAPMRRGFLLRDRKWAYLQYGENAGGGRELFDMTKDPGQFTNLVEDPSHAEKAREFQQRLAAKLKSVRTNDLDIDYGRERRRRN